MNVNGTSAIITDRLGAAGIITLNEPASLNALTLQMVQELSKQLTAWQEDPAIGWVVVKGAGERAFSAGANVRAMWKHAATGEYPAIVRFFSAEYALQLLLSEYRKPCIAVVDGICFGGGMGLAVNAGLSVATEVSRFCMPETLIGFVPDAGASYFLSRLPHALGLFLGLTGSVLTGADAVRLGLINRYVPHEFFNRLVTEIVRLGPEYLATIDFPLPAFSFEDQRDRIGRCFDCDSLQDVYARLEAENDTWAQETRANLRRRSPAALERTFEILRCPGGDLRECLVNELAAVEVATRHPDFQEGVRAALIDADKSPRWQGI